MISLDIKLLIIYIFLNNSFLHKIFIIILYYKCRGRKGVVNMETIISILIFVGVMVAMNKLGLGCCGGRKSDHKEKSSKKSCCGLEK